MAAPYHAAVKRVLITGMSATGKSTVLGQLAARGYKTVDTDYGDWTERVELPDAVDHRGASHEWLWREDRIAHLLSTEDAVVLFVSGTVRNQVKFYGQFDHIVLLSAPASVMRDRLRSRVNNPYGRRPDELAEILAFKQTVEPSLRRAAHLEIDTSAPLEEVVASIERLVSR
jgi:dephospho-CoA kinase